MRIENLSQLYQIELQEMRSVEAQLVEALPRLTEIATRAELRQAMEDHLQETRRQQQQVEDLLRARGADVEEHHDQAMHAVIDEAQKWAGMIADAETCNAAIIASAQRIEHFEIAAYGALVAWAEQLGYTQDREVLQTILDEEKHANQLLTDVATSTTNPMSAEA